MSLNPDDLKLLYPLFLITLKPVMYVANVNEGGFENNQHLENVIEYAKNHGSNVFPYVPKLNQKLQT
jgi:ribosome-binding ATPase YchF (GTP1/OBG family)